MNRFYADLPSFENFSEFSQPRHYTPLPEDWIVVISDVQGSTRAIENGHYKDVNTLGAASIMALLNAVKPLEIPFVFGGDGALLCVPREMKEKVQAALLGTKQMAEKAFGLSLRIGMVDMAELKQRGRTVLVGKFQPTPHYEQAMFLGDGIELAESLVKSLPPNPHLLSDDAGAPNADFTGFECRWQEIPGPHGETLAVLVTALTRDAETASKIYLDTVKDIYEIFGRESTHHPLRADMMKTALSPLSLWSEIQVKGWRHAPKLIFYTWIGRWLMWRKIKTGSTDWGRYPERLIANTDFRKFDGSLRMIISGTKDQSTRLRQIFERRRQAGEIAFGIHSNPATIITCLVSDYNQGHVHFVDGSTGGYTLAAKELKSQLIKKI